MFQKGLQNGIGKPQFKLLKVRNYPAAVNALDHNKRTPLHYAAAVNDGGKIYKMLRKAGGDPHILDCVR